MLHHRKANEIDIFDQLLDVIARNKLSNGKILKSCNISKGKMTRCIRGDESLSIGQFQEIIDLLGYELVMMKRENVDLSNLKDPRKMKREFK